MDAVLLAQIRNSSAFNQMLAKNRYLLLRAKKTSVNIVHRGLFFQASSSLASAHDFPIPSEAGHSEYSGTRNINRYSVNRIPVESAWYPELQAYLGVRPFGREDARAMARIV